jgi:hypothetical protein
VQGRGGERRARTGELVEQPQRRRAVPERDVHLGVVGHEAEVHEVGGAHRGPLAVHDARLGVHVQRADAALAQPGALRRHCQILPLPTLPLPVLIPKQLGLGVNKTGQQLCFQQKLLFNKTILIINNKGSLYSGPVS